MQDLDYHIIIESKSDHSDILIYINIVPIINTTLVRNMMILTIVKYAVVVNGLMLVRYIVSHVKQVDT